MVLIRRFVSILFALVMAFAASLLGAGYFFADGAQWLDFIRIGLLAITTAWLAWGAVLAINGLFWGRIVPAPVARSVPDVTTAVLVPVYNEDPIKTFSHIAAMIDSLALLDAGHRFEFAVLSDTNNSAVAELEEEWFVRLKQEFGSKSKLYYRRREANTGKKAGNIADFIKTSGELYKYLIILDADSLMEGSTMIEMVHRMEEDPKLGLLQSLPKVIRARSFFGRAIQFSASYYSPAYSRGLAALQGDEGPFWGHNAITRTQAFAQSCGLPPLPGKAPFGGHILSHDYVEAALLSRNGWSVRVDPDLVGSLEEGPDNVLDYAKRDRRWCQGNLQHARILAAPGLKLWSRFVFLQGIMAYIAAPLWALFLIAAIIAPTITIIPDYFPVPGLPVFPRVMQENAVALLTGVLGLLIGPKLLILLDGIVTGRNRGFGGNLRCILGMLTEIICTSILAPLMMLFQTRAVLQILSGMDGGWPTANREAEKVGLAEAWSASWWIVVIGLLTLGAAWQMAPQYLLYIALVAVPQVMAPIIISITSHSNANPSRSGLFQTVEESAPTPVMRNQQVILSRWRSAAPSDVTLEIPVTVTPSHSIAPQPGSSS